ncbi:MAG TPA: ankyrin repeat domain-containing protein [Rickettsia endosymbiont of Pyrocoelia pectoralis]|nr:ankyrin repeat domain-containing protein [Rickettsia endosymbiont of Pyrocoelia pectoralis]
MTLREAIKTKNEVEAEKLIAEMDSTKLSQLQWDYFHESLMSAIQQGLEKTCELLIKKMPDSEINHIYSGGSNALHLAAESGLEEICKLLIKRMPDDEINRISSRGFSTLETSIDMTGGKDKVFSLIINKVSKNIINNTFYQKTKKGKAFIKQKISENNEKAKKLAILLNESFGSENNSNDPLKIANAVKFYEVVNKDLLKKYLIKEQEFYLGEEQEVNNIDSILIKMDDFIKANPFLIKGICKVIQPDSENTSPYLPNEILYNIVSYLEHEKWGIDVKNLGENNQGAS